MHTVGKYKSSAMKQFAFLMEIYYILYIYIYLYELCERFFFHGICVLHDTHWKKNNIHVIFGLLESLTLDLKPLTSGWIGRTTTIIQRSTSSLVTLFSKWKLVDNL